MFTFFKFVFRSYRYADYKQYTWWIHDQLGKGVQKVIPSCAVQAIRNSFPSENQEYTPFIEKNDDEDRTFQ